MRERSSMSLRAEVDSAIAAWVRGWAFIRFVEPSKGIRGAALTAPEPFVPHPSAQRNSERPEFLQTPIPTRTRASYHWRERGVNAHSGSSCATDAQAAVRARAAESARGPTGPHGPESFARLVLVGAVAPISAPRGASRGEEEFGCVAREPLRSLSCAPCSSSTR